VDIIEYEKEEMLYDLIGNVEDFDQAVKSIE